MYQPIYPYCLGLIHRHWGSRMVSPVPMKQPWIIWAIPSHASRMVDDISRAWRTPLPDGTGQVKLPVEQVNFFPKLSWGAYVICIGKVLEVWQAKIFGFVKPWFLQQNKTWNHVHILLDPLYIMYYPWFNLLSLKSITFREVLFLNMMPASGSTAGVWWTWPLGRWISVDWGATIVDVRVSPSFGGVTLCYLCIRSTPQLPSIWLTPMLTMLRCGAHDCLDVCFSSGPGGFNYCWHCDVRPTWWWLLGDVPVWGCDATQCRYPLFAGLSVFGWNKE